jgi:hypothetical protein
VSALAAGWLTVLVVAFADVPAAVRLTVLAAVAQAVFLAGWVLAQREDGAGPALLAIGTLAGAALAPLALLHGLPARTAAVVAIVLLPLGAAGLALAASPALSAGGVAVLLLAGCGLPGGRRGQGGWLAVAAFGLAAVAAGLGVGLAGTLAAGVLGLTIAADRLLPAVPRGAGAVLLLPCLLPIAAAAGPLALAPLGAGLGLVGWGWLRGRRR